MDINDAINQFITFSFVNDKILNNDSACNNGCIIVNDSPNETIEEDDE